MKKRTLIFVTLAIVILKPVIGQNPTITKMQDSKNVQLTLPESSVDYSITSYKNVDFLKTDPFKLEAAGIHTEIYISNTHKGVIIISSSDANKDLKYFSHTLALNPSYYETLTTQDTTIFLSGNNKNPDFDFTKASSINHDYINAFHYTVDPSTGVSWSKGTHKDFLQGDVLGKAVYDLIIVLPKTKK